jgi:hypothetical protein
MHVCATLGRQHFFEVLEISVNVIRNMVADVITTFGSCRGREWLVFLWIIMIILVIPLVIIAKD